MNPDDAYLIIRASAHALTEHTDDLSAEQVTDAVVSLLAAWQALDLWLSGGGHAPREWQLREPAHASADVQPDTSMYGYV